MIQFLERAKDTWREGRKIILDIDFDCLGSGS